MKNMTYGDPESINNFKASGGLLKWILSNGVMNLFVVVMIYSTVDSIIHALSWR